MTTMTDQERSEILKAPDIMSELMMIHDAELHPDLRKYVQKGPPWDMLRSPQIYEVPYSPKLNAYINYRYERRKKMLGEALMKQEWEKLFYADIGLIEGPYKLQMLEHYGPLIPPERYWPILGDVWVHVENAHQQPVKALHKLWRMYKTSNPRTLAMSPDEVEAYNALPDELTIFRGHSRKKTRRIGDLSWTLNRDVAFWFAKRFKQPEQEKCLLVGKVKKKHVWAHFTCRNEDEIVVARNRVYDVVEIGYKAT